MFESQSTNSRTIDSEGIVSILPRRQSIILALCVVLFATLTSLGAFAASTSSRAPVGGASPDGAARQPQATETEPVSRSPADPATTAGHERGSEDPARPVIEKVEPAEVTRGADVTVSGSGFPPSREQIEIRLDEHKIVPREVDPNGKWFTFVAPTRSSEQDGAEATRKDASRADTDISRLGSYRVSVFVATAVKKDAPTSWVPAGGRAHRLRILPDTEGQLELIAIHPTVSYPGNKDGVSVMGSGFSREHTDNIPVIDGRELPVCKRSDCSKCSDGEVCVTVVSGRQLQLSNVPRDELLGPRELRIRVGDSLSNPIPVTFSRVDKRVPLWGAAVFVCCVVVAIVLMASRTTKLVSGETLSRWGALFFDKETQSYSVGMLQLYLWWSAAIFGYVYLTVARSLVQGNLDLAPLPDRLPGIVMISSSTSVLAIGITSVRGPKGAGGIKPSLLDFVTVGGLVAAERVQFLIWTVIGVTSFFLLVVLHDPARIQDLPEIPEGFLYLMGISSFGYLGGKFARKSGPVIESVDVAPPNTPPQSGPPQSPQSIELRIRGRNLSRDAGVYLDDELAKLARGTRPETPEMDDREPNGEYAKLLSLRIETADPQWPTRPHEITVRNPDGQVAVGRVVPRGNVS
ncbi:hypothetical protein [Sorangium sp. So ce1000]|uniref:hypothetical protein n=1 Tax=Sorangium sp. So ce1000 TaxID=3133325 RepID=UPI003F5F279A